MHILSEMPVLDHLTVAPPDDGGRQCGQNGTKDGWPGKEDEWGGLVKWVKKGQ